MPALSYKNDPDADSRLNPAEMEREAIDGFDRSADGLDDHPISAGVADGQEPSSPVDSARNLSEREANPSSWNTNLGSMGAAAASMPGMGKFQMLAGKLKKGGPSGAILGTGIVGILISSSLGAPALYLVHIVETFTQRWDFQQVSMSNSNLKVLNSKLDKVNEKYCGEKITMRCRMSSFNETELKNLEKQGIKAEGGRLSKVTGRLKPTGFLYIDSMGKEQRLNPAQLRSAIHNPASEIHRRNITAYSPKLAGFSDKVAIKSLHERLKISKKRPFLDSDATDEDRHRRIKSIAETGEPDGPRIGASSEVACDGEGQPKCADVKEKNDSIKDANEVANAAEEARKNGVNPGLGEKINAGAGLFGGAQSGCSLLQTMNMVSMGAKTTKALQMARFAFTFATVASMIKAGDAKEQDVRYLSDLFTKTKLTRKKVGSTVVQVESKPGTDSAVYKNTAFGDKITSESSMMFNAGGGFTNNITALKNKVLSLVGGEKNAKTTCNIVNSPLGQVASIGGGIATLFTPVGAAKMAGQIALQQAISEVAQRYLMPMAIGIAAGIVIDKNTVGEFAMDAFGSGYQKTASEVANAGGGAPMTPSQAATNSVAMKRVSLEHAVYERDTHSPFDPMSPYTMIGTVVGSLLPYSSQFADISSIASGAASLVGKSFSSLLAPNVGAYDGVETEEDYVSTDTEYNEGGFATTRQNIVVTGLPEEVSNLEPNDVYVGLVSHVKLWCQPSERGCIWREDPDPHIDWETGEPLSLKYKMFIKQCIDREIPWNDPEGANNWVSDEQSKGAGDCQISGAPYPTGMDEKIGPGTVTPDPDGIIEAKAGMVNKDSVLSPAERNMFYAWYNHFRTLTNREEGIKAASNFQNNAVVTENTSSASFTPGSYADSTIPCPNGTKDLGVIQTKYKGSLVTTPLPKIRLCRITSITGIGAAGQVGSESGGGAVFNSAVAGVFQELGTRAKAAGLQLNSGSSFRWADSCGGGGSGSACAKPGSSTHQLGIAIDFSLSDGHKGSSTTSCAARATSNDPRWKWLKENAPGLGIKQYTYENWHWDTSGLGNRC